MSRGEIAHLRQTPGGYTSKLEWVYKLRFSPAWRFHARATPRHNEWERWFHYQEDEA